MDLLRKTTIIRNVLLMMTATMILYSTFIYVRDLQKIETIEEIATLEANGIVVTTKAGISSLRSVMDVKRSLRYADTEFIYGEISGDNIVIGICDGNKVTAASVSSILLSSFKVKNLLLINTGVGIIKDLPIGAVVVGSEIYQFDIGIKSASDFIWNSKSGIKFQGGRIPTDRENRDSYLAKISDVFSHVLIGNLATGDIQVYDSEYAKKLHNDFNAIVADSEAAAAGLVSYAFEKPFTSITLVTTSAFYEDIENRGELDISTKDSCVGKIISEIFKDE